jgi:DNA-binding transcriptional LysR family regulator
MDQLAAMRALLAVADHGGFSGAGRRLGVAASSVARLVDALEEHLGGVPLLNRSTRRVSLTDAGRAFRDDAARVLADLRAAEEAVAASGRSERDGPRGLLRVTVPAAFGRRHVAPTLPAFHAACPGIELDMVFTDAVLDLAEADVDLAVRLGGPAGSPAGLIARRLAPHRRVVCAGPGYLAARGTPAAPEDLAAHACLAFRYAEGRRAWRFRAAGGGAEREVRVSGPLRADDAEALRLAALGGLGLALLPTWLVGEDLRAGRLVAVLEGWEAEPGRAPPGVFALYRADRRGSARLRVFLDHLAACFVPAPPWEGGSGAVRATAQKARP